MKKRILYLLTIVCFGAYFAGQILTASAGPAPKLILDEVPVCGHAEESVDENGDIYFAGEGECLKEVGPQQVDDERVPTAIKLVHTGTEIRDPISTAGIVITFFVLVALTVLWIGMVRNWNRAEDA